MLARIMSLHSDVVALHEPLPTLNTEAYLKWSGSINEDQARQFVWKNRKELVRQVAWGSKQYLESSLFMSLFIDELNYLFNAKFIHLHRDGRDFVRSGASQGWYLERKGKENLKTVVKSSLRRRLALYIGTSLGNSNRDFRLSPPSHCESRIQKIAWLWDEVNQIILNDLSHVPKDERMEVKLGDFGPEKLREMHEFMSLRQDSNLIIQMSQIAAKKPNKSNEHIADPYEGWSKSDKAAFERISGSMMSRLGYW